MRTLEGHKVNPADESLAVIVIDEPGAGGANHHYLVAGGDSVSTHIMFQNGPIAEVGVNGLTHEALLVIVADRLRSFQDGPYACNHNHMALHHVTEAMYWLKARTIERMARNVEGTHKL